MDRQIARKIMAVLETARCDPGCRHLYPEYEAVNRQLLAQMDAMNEAQRAAVLDYIGLVAQIHMKQLILALEYQGDPA